MNRKELLELALEQQEQVKQDKLNRELYFQPGIDNTARLFLHSIKENQFHQRRKDKFDSYSGYESRY